MYKKNQEIFLDLADFALQEQPEDNLMVAIFREWYNGLYTVAAKPIKSLEWHLRWENTDNFVRQWNSYKKILGFTYVF